MYCLLETTHPLSPTGKSGRLVRAAVLLSMLHAVWLTHGDPRSLQVPISQTPVPSSGHPSKSVPLLTALVELLLRPPALPGPAAALSGAFLEASLRIGPISQVHPQAPVDSNVSQGWTEGTGLLSVTQVQTRHLLLSWRRRWMIDVDTELPRQPPVPLHRPPCLQPPAPRGLPEG